MGVSSRSAVFDMTTAKSTPNLWVQNDSNMRDHLSMGRLTLPGFISGLSRNSREWRRKSAGQILSHSRRILPLWRSCPTPKIEKWLKHLPCPLWCKRPRRQDEESLHLPSCASCQCQF